MPKEVAYSQLSFVDDADYVMAMIEQGKESMIVSLLEDMFSDIRIDIDNECMYNPLSINKYEMGFGDDVVTATSIDEVMSTPFF